jgi:hypothetical protein
MIDRRCITGDEMESEYPIYKLFFVKRGPRALGMPEAEFQSILEKTRPLAERMGVRRMLVANMGWSNERFGYFGVELFPNLSVQQAYTHALEEIDWFSDVDGESYLGIPMDGTANNITPPPMPPPGEKSVYRVYLSRLTDYGAGLAPEQLSEMWGLGCEALHRANGRILISGYVRWNNEEWESFGIERFPSHEAVLAYSQFLSISGWYRVTAARSYLGTSLGGEIAPPQI